MRTLKAEFQDMKGKIDSMHVAMLGSIDQPETVRNSILARVEDHAKHVQFWRKFGWAFILSMLTIPPAVVTAVFLTLIHVKP